jgi:hypothetical protein
MGPAEGYWIDHTSSASWAATDKLDAASAQVDAQPQATRGDFHLGQLSGPASFTKNAFVDT